MARRKKKSPQKKRKSPLKFTKISDKFLSVKPKEISKKVEIPEEPEPVNEEEILKQFDLNWEFGPCIGITRLERWERAEKFGLNPPKIVREILVKHNETEDVNKCIWNYYYNIL